MADIHGNADARAAVLAAARGAGVDRLLIAGDLTGYYYDTDAVLDLLDDWEWTAVRGNHEEMLADWREEKDCEILRRKYGSSLEEACARLTVSQLDTLTGLPHPLRVALDGATALLCHGAPWDVDEYVYPDAGEPTVARLFADDASLVVTGHTHYPAIRRDGAATAVNPGSVGQPRDGRPGACWALWDTDSGDVALRREDYDSGPLVAACRARDPHLPYLADVLTRTG